VTVAIGSGGGELGGTRQVSTDASGQAAFTDLSISGTPGPRTLVFTAPGHAQATSSEIELQAIGTTTTITGDSPDPSGVGSTVTVSFRVTSEGPTPTGSVTVSDGSQSCSATLSNGTGSCPLALSTVGVRTLTASYAGLPGLLGSSDTEPHTVTAAPPPPPAGTTTTITSDSPDPSVAGSTITVSFQVTSGGGTPTGSVTVSVSGGGPSCTDDLSGGSGSCQLTLNVVGDRTLTATYSGAGGFAASSDTEAHRVNAPEPDNEEPDADYNWHCEGLTCQFTDASDDDDGGVVSWRWDFGGTGTSDQKNPRHTFPGPGEYQVTLTVTDNRGASDASTAGVDVEAPPPPNQAPTAEFTWRCDELECDFESQSRDPDGDIEDYDWTFGDGGESDDDDPDHRFPASGTYQVTLTVTDDDEASSSVTHAVTVTAAPPPPANTTTTITGDGPDPSDPGQSITVSFTVTSGSGTPSGNVQVSDANGGGCAADATAGNCSYTPQGVGQRTITATYAGNSSFNESSDTEQHTVSPPPPAGTTTTITGVTPEPSDPGQSITVSFTVTSGAGTPSGNVQVSDANGGGCAADVAAGSCSYTPQGTGQRTITATYAGNSSFSESSDTEQHTVTEPAPEPGSLRLSTQPPSDARSGEPLEGTPEVELLSSTGEEFRRAGVQVSVAVLGATAGLSGTTTRETDDNGRARFEDLAISGDPGLSVTLTFSAPDFAPVDSQTITITEGDDGGGEGGG
jgi:PKD repeat protein